MDAERKNANCKERFLLQSINIFSHEGCTADKARQDPDSTKEKRCWGRVSRGENALLVSRSKYHHEVLLFLKKKIDTR